MPVLEHAGRPPTQSHQECQALSQSVDDARRAKDRDGEIAALQALVTHPCSIHEVDLPGVWAELATALWSARRWDDAIEARESAIAAGYRSVPHPRAEIAEILLDAGRRSEAGAIYTGLHEGCRDDVRLYNSAGWAYARAGDHREALRWLDEGIEVALTSGDPDDLLDQLMDYRRSSREALGATRRRAGVACRRLPAPAADPQSHPQVLRVAPRQGQRLADTAGGSRLSTRPSRRPAATSPAPAGQAASTSTVTVGDRT
ncbi:MAG: tetratricopeptide repeat protein [Acidimicrobiales bacterium]